VSYDHRNKGNPLYLLNVVAGYENGKPYIGYIDYYGNYLENNYFLTGFA